MEFVVTWQREIVIALFVSVVTFIRWKGFLKNGDGLWAILVAIFYIIPLLTIFIIW